MDELTAVRGAVDRLVAGALGPLLDLLAEDVEFEVASEGDVPGCRKDSGKQAVVDYFAALGDLPAFWRIDYRAAGGRVVAWGVESFTLAGCELEGGTEFALVLDLRQGRVTRLLVIEDLSFIPGWDFAGATGLPSATVAGERPTTTRTPGRRAVLGGGMKLDEPIRWRRTDAPFHRAYRGLRQLRWATRSSPRHDRHRPGQTWRDGAVARRPHRQARSARHCRPRSRTIHHETSA